MAPTQLRKHGDTIFHVVITRAVNCNQFYVESLMSQHLNGEVLD